MADSKLITSIGEELECPVCAEYFTDARFLSCMHTFCRRCLEKCDKTYGRGGKSSMHCPLCRKVTYLPKNGVVGLQTDFTSNRLVTRLKENIEDRKKAAGVSQNSGMTCQSCQEGGVSAYCLSCSHFICQSCQSLHRKKVAMRTHEVIPLKDLRRGNVVLVRNQKVQFCNVHKLDTVCFCYTCTRYLCDLCCQLDHDGHDFSESIYKTKGEGANNKRDCIRKAMRELSKVTSCIGEQKNKVKRLRATVKLHYGALKDQVKSSHDLRLRKITRVMKENCDDLTKDLQQDEEKILNRIAFVDENLGHSESRVLEAKAIGENAITDGQHAEIAFVKGYLESVITSVDEDNNVESRLMEIERYAKGLRLLNDSADQNIESLSCFGRIVKDVWELDTKCQLPIEASTVRSVKFDPVLECFLISCEKSIYSIDLQGTVSHVVDLLKDQALHDMAIAEDGTSRYMLCNDNRIRVFGQDSWDSGTVLDIPRVDTDSALSCIAVNKEGSIVIGDQSARAVIWCSPSASTKMTGISPIQMEFTSSGDLAVVCRSIREVNDTGNANGGKWNQAGVAVRVYGLKDGRENTIAQNNWQAAAVAVKHDDAAFRPGRFYALGLYVTDDGKQLASLAEYDNIGTKKESMFEETSLPIDLNNGTRPQIAADASNTIIAVYTGKEVRLCRKRRSDHD